MLLTTSYRLPVRVFEFFTRTAMTTGGKLHVSYRTIVVETLRVFPLPLDKEKTCPQNYRHALSYTRRLSSIIACNVANGSQSVSAMRPEPCDCVRLRYEHEAKSENTCKGNVRYSCAYLTGCYCCCILIERAVLFLSLLKTRRRLTIWVNIFFRYAKSTYSSPGPSSAALPNAVRDVIIRDAMWKKKKWIFSSKHAALS